MRDPEACLKSIISTLASKRAENNTAPLWSVVAELVCVGSTHASEIVASVGLDPAKIVERPQWLSANQVIGNVCEKCDEVFGFCGETHACGDLEDSDLDDNCPACGGTGEVPDNGTNNGECDECCGTGVFE